MRREALLENLIAALCLSLKLLNGAVKVFYSRFLLGFAITNHNLSLGIDVERRTAAGALDFK